MSEVVDPSCHKSHDFRQTLPLEYVLVFIVSGNNSADGAELADVFATEKVA